MSWSNYVFYQAKFGVTIICSQLTSAQHLSEHRTKSPMQNSWSWQGFYRCLLFFESSQYVTSFLRKDLHQFLFLPTSETGEDFRPHEKRQKAKPALSAVLPGVLIKAHVAPRRPTQLLLWGPHSASQRQATTDWTGSVSVCALSRFVLCIS